MKKKKYEIDAKSLFLCLWNDKKKMLIYISVAFVAGIIIAFTTPKEYTTSVKLAPEESHWDTPLCLRKLRIDRPAMTD